MPYNVEVDKDRVLVGSVFDSKIIAFHKDSKEPLKIWAMSSDNWGSWWAKSIEFLPQSWHLFDLIGERRNGYDNVNVRVDIAGKCYHPGYGCLMPCNEGDNPIEVPTIDGVYMYFIQVLQDKEAALIFSPQNRNGIIFNKKTGTRADISIGEGRWKIGNYAVGPKDVLSLRDAVGMIKDPEFYN